MPMAAKAVRSAAKKEIMIREETSTTLLFTVPEGLLPAAYERGLHIFPGDDLGSLFPGEEHRKIRQLCASVQPTRTGDVDHVCLLPPQKTRTKFRVQLRDTIRNSAGVQLRIMKALEHCGYQPLLSSRK